MAMVVTIDANVLYGSRIRVLLLQIAREDLYRPTWSEEILAEVGRSLLATRPDLGHERIGRAIERLRLFDEASIIDDYQDLIPAMRNHEKDRHVLAAAVKAGAGVIVTWNKRHFPPHASEPYEIQIQDPDEFLVSLWYQTSAGVSRALRRTAEDFDTTVPRLMEDLRRQVKQFAEVVQESSLVSD